MKQKYSRSFSIGIVGILAMLFLAWVFSIGCGNNSVSEYKKSPPDTVKTQVQLVSLFDWQKLGIPRQQWGLEVFKVIKDTLILDSIDANTSKRIWKRDSIYYAIVPIAEKDSLDKEILDSLKRPKVNTWKLDIPKDNILWDYNKSPKQ